MLRALLIILVVALLLWAGQRYYMEHPNALEFLSSKDDVSSPPESPAVANSSAAPSSAAGSGATANGAPTPTPTPTFSDRLKGWRKSLWTVAQKVLTPLDQSKDYSAADVTRMLQATQRDMELYKPAPNYQHLTEAYNRVMQASLLLGQAVQERQSYTERYQRDAATPTPTANSGLKLATLQPSYDLKGAETDTNAFFQGRVVAEWHDRYTSYYEPLIDGLLTTPD